MRFVSAFALLAGFAIAPSALAANARAEVIAREVLKRAANDYLAMNYAKGAVQLEQALRACGVKSCAAVTRAALWRDLGTMQFRMGDKGDALRSFAAALVLKADLDLNPDYDGADLRAVWGQVQHGAASPTGDFEHTPPAQQKTNTPLPLYVEAGPEEAARVVVKYQPTGEGEWKSIDLKRMGSGWGGLIPCADVTEGTLRYFIQAFTAGSQPVGANGDAKRSYVVAIRDDAPGDALHLPGAKPPAVCENGGAAPDKGTDGDQSAAHGTDDEPEFAKSDAASHETAAPSESTGPRIWLGAALAIDFMTPPSGDNLCRLDPNTARPANTANVYCVTADGADFPSRNDGGAQNGALTPGRAGQSSGNVVAGGVRLLVALDVAFGANWLAGLRVGGVFGQYPGQQAVRDGASPGASYHVEGRVSWVIGDHPLNHVGLAPLVFVGGGLSEFDEHASSSVTVRAYRDLTGANHAAQNAPVDLWVTNGPGFVVVGGGVRYAPVRRIAVTGALRATESFGKNGLIPAIGPEVTVQYGLW